MGTPTSGMLYREYLSAFRRAAGLWESHFRLEAIGEARSNPGPEPLIRLATKRHRPGGMMIMAGFHGEEPAGPVCLLRCMHQILGKAHDLDVPITIYPVVNPFGFDHNRRTTVDGSVTNAGFVHDDDEPGPEVEQLKADMQNAGADVFLDLHEDDHESRFYLYTFGEEELATRLVDVGATFLPVAQDALSHTPTMGVSRGQVRDHHDGSAEDFMGHHGARASFASETPTQRDMRLRVAVNLALIETCLDDIARRRA